jgi:hypothetical protein
MIAGYRTHYSAPWQELEAADGHKAGRGEYKDFSWRLVSDPRPKCEGGFSCDIPLSSREIHSMLDLGSFDPGTVLEHHKRGRFVVVVNRVGNLQLEAA